MSHKINSPCGHYHFTFMIAEGKSTRQRFLAHDDDASRKSIHEIKTVNEAIESIRSGDNVLGAFTFLTKHLRSVESQLFSLQMLFDSGLTPVVLQFVDPSLDPVTLEITLELVDYLSEADQPEDSAMKDPAFLQTLVDVMMGPYMRPQLCAMNIARNLLTDEATRDTVIDVLLGFQLPEMLFRGHFFDRDRSERAVADFENLPCSPLTASLGLLEALLERMSVDAVTPNLATECLNTLKMDFLAYDPDQRFSLLVVLWKLLKIESCLELVIDSGIPEILLRSLAVCHDHTAGLVYRDIACLFKRGFRNEMFFSDEFFEQIIHFLTCGDRDVKLEILRLLRIYVSTDVDIFGNEMLLECLVNVAAHDSCQTRTQASLLLTKCLTGPFHAKLGLQIVECVIQALPTVEDKNDLVQAAQILHDVIERGGPWAEALRVDDKLQLAVNELYTTNPEEIQVLASILE